jgi:hypothetical protein
VESDAPDRNRPHHLEDTMSGLFDKAKDFADQHDDKVDEGLQKAGEQIDARTGEAHSEQIQRGVDEAQRRTGDGDQVP